MIQQIANRYQKITAASMLFICFSGMILPAHAFNRSSKKYSAPRYTYSSNNSAGKYNDRLLPYTMAGNKPVSTKNSESIKAPQKTEAVKKASSPTIGGPTQPEMTAFKPVGTTDMVNLFTGDFSYNIPLLDVGGYPVNIFYDGGVGVEQEASWVGLGWNINPGNVQRNMRGVPDDFDGTDIMEQTMAIKPNVNWGVNTGFNAEIAGLSDLIKVNVGAQLGVSFNNYLGPALELGVKGNVGLKVASKNFSEKAPLSLGVGLGINASSRSGVTFSPSVSMTASTHRKGHELNAGFGLGISTGYNSRSGIKGMQITEQVSLSKNDLKYKCNGMKEVMNWAYDRHSVGAGSSTSISFTKPSYIPSMRMPLTNTAWSGHFKLGFAIYAIYPSFEIEVFKQKSQVAPDDRLQKKPMVGYLYMEKANNNPHAVMDFTRLNDNEVTKTTPIISAPQYAYDVFSIQGEGTGGSVRAYRNDDGYVRDNYTISKDKSISAGIDIGIIGQYGFNFNIIKTPSSIGEWKKGNNLKSLQGFTSANGTYENVYFRNPGENSVLNDDQYNKIGGANLVRFKMGGSGASPTANPVLERFAKDGTKLGDVNMLSITNPAERKKRTQVISFLNAEEASIAGLDKTIKNYDGMDVLTAEKNLKFTEIPRFDGTIRKKHHISQVNVTEAGGQRYVYGIPVYNIEQRDFTFTVANSTESSDDKVATNGSEPITLNEGSKDGYLQITKTPAFAHSFLLSGLLSPDYVDVTGNGITEDDLGGAVKFNYSKMDEYNHWSTPISKTTLEANFNSGKRTENKDDKGIISYGKRESWYVHSIESKTMIALFKLENREDGKGVTGPLEFLNPNDNSAKRLKQIDLYSKADLKKNGLSGAKPIKTVHFEYSYTLCSKTPNNNNPTGGKLTLEKIWFTFNGQNRASKNQYVFNYGSTADNPEYAFNASDRWGNYKPKSANPAGLKNSDYPYSIQDKTLKTSIDQNASAWMLKKILLPSGGQMEIAYESDDYAFVQNKRAAIMMKVLGFGSNNSSYSNRLYGINGLGFTENTYAFIQVPEACANKQEVYEKYLKGNEQLSFKLGVLMPKGMEPLHSYAFIDGANYDVFSGDATHKTIWVKMKTVDGLSPLSLTAVEFLREQLPGQAFRGYDVSESDGLAQVGEMLIGLFDGLKGAFKNPVKTIRQSGKAQSVDITQCFVRLNDPDGFKYGGGYRVKSVKLKDNWRKMNQNQLYTSEYGQEYDYTTTEIFNGAERTISSGVASYEPSLGGDENPFQTMIQISNTVPLGPASYGAIEMPVLDAFFPSPLVGYSKVTVRSIKKGVQDPSKKSRSGIGKQVTEYYTAKDFPVYYSNTSFDPGTDKNAHSKTFGFFFYKYAADSRALSQGFLVETNDMHGKMKSQASYAENDAKTLINYTENFYRNTGVKGFDEKFDFVHASQGGLIKAGNMGIDVELMTDTREFSVKSTSIEIQGQLDLFPVVLPFWFPFIWPVVANSDNVYRAITTTKVISYHSILDSTLVIDKGSQVSTKNLVYDAETGQVVVNRTNNEFKQPIYSTTYPAYWAYSGMGLAYKNIDAVYKNVNIRDGKITSNNVPVADLESGDELFLINEGTPPNDACAASFNLAAAPNRRLWVYETHKNTTSLTLPPSVAPDLYLMDEQGKFYTRNGVSFRIIRSGKRNILGEPASAVTSFNSPIKKINVVTRKLFINDDNNVVNASAVEYREKWQTDNDVFKRYITTENPSTCTSTDTDDCTGLPEKKINPYRKGLLGTFRSNLSKVFYGNRREANPSSQTAIAKNGFLENFKLYWDFDGNNLVPDNASTKWVWNSRINKVNAKGLELETKDALGIYTSAQYGFNKTTPVAIASNSRYNEMFAEGFEDDNYNEALNNNTNSVCLKKHISFSGLDNSGIVDIEQDGFRAHSGKRVLKVNTNSTSIKTVSLNSVIDDAYSLDLETRYGLSTAGPYANVEKISSVPSSEPVSSVITFTTGSSLGLSYQISNNNAPYGHPYVEISNGVANFNAFYKVTQYFKIPVAQTYTFNISAHQYMERYHPETDGNPIFNRTAIIVRIKKISGELIMDKVLYSDQGLSTPTWNNSSTLSQTITLECGDYVIETYPSADATAEFTPPSTPSGFWRFLSEASYTAYPPIYTYPPGCPFKKPISATEQMINQEFSITPGKKMLFSAWVKEGCGTPCLKNDFTNSNIEIWSDGVNLGLNKVKRTGAIIEGWQKIEGEFEVPANTTATTAQIKFINANNAAMYVDDIRIHPFNANVKGYVYDPVNLRLMAELDANNFGSFYEYDDEGTLIRTKAETKEGIKTITETRSAKQKNITTFQ